MSLRIRVITKSNILKAFAYFKNKQKGVMFFDI